MGDKTGTRCSDSSVAKSTAVPSCHLSPPQNQKPRERDSKAERPGVQRCQTETVYPEYSIPTAPSSMPKKTVLDMCSHTEITGCSLRSQCSQEDDVIKLYGQQKAEQLSFLSRGKPCTVLPRDTAGCSPFRHKNSLSIKRWY